MDEKRQEGKPILAFFTASLLRGEINQGSEPLIAHQPSIYAQQIEGQQDQADTGDPLDHQRTDPLGDQIGRASCRERV